MSLYWLSYYFVQNPNDMRREKKYLLLIHTNLLLYLYLKLISGII